ncbi:unnamed protein product [Cylicocyclus nassatus]|uniref:Uncharacterized protein n=1 Tax=Cylicocyclus nassatus TaxID=53992 RepID=A0AA36GL10_CYLNA|nr:unnamed protein product [Cylicocyclus nassatus]
MCAKFGPDRLRNGIFCSEHTAEPDDLADTACACIKRCICRRCSAGPPNSGDIVAHPIQRKPLRQFDKNEKFQTYLLVTYHLSDSLCC